MPKSYAADIKPLFRPKDIACMAGRGVALDHAAFMCDRAGDETFADHAHARQVYSRLTNEMHPMPPDGRWPQPQLDIYSAWMSDGFAP